MAEAAQVFAVLSEDEQRTLLGLLDRVTEALGERLPRPTADRSARCPSGAGGSGTPAPCSRRPTLGIRGQP
jgi:hypothetical protein